MDVPQPQLPDIPREVPPYEGFQIGSEEDSLANCLNLIPKPPKRDFIKFMEKDRLGICAVHTHCVCVHTKPVNLCGCNICMYECTCVHESTITQNIRMHCGSTFSHMEPVL